MQITISPARRAATVLAVMLTAGACGDDSTTDRSEDSSILAPTTTASAVTTVASTPIEPATIQPATDPSEWVANLNRAQQEMNANTLEAFMRIGDPSTPGWGTLAFEVESLGELTEISEEFLLALEDPPIEVADEAEDWALTIQESIERSQDTAEALLGLGVPMDTPVSDVPPEVLEQLPGMDVEPAFSTEDACFALAEKVADAGFGIVDCTGSEDRVAEQATGPGPVPVGRHDLSEPGVYSFDTLPRPFSIEIAEPTSVVVGEEGVEFTVEEAGDAPFFHVVAVDEIVDPAFLLDYDGPFTFDQMVPTDDLAGWFDQLPFEVDTGITLVGDVEVPYWRLLDVEFSGGDLPMFVWASSSLQGGHLITPGSVFWEVPHPDGSLIVYANKVVEAPDDVSGIERLAIGEDFLALLRVP